MIAILAALKNSELLTRSYYSLGNESLFRTSARLPQARYDEDTGQTVCSRKVKEPLKISRIPIAASFGIFDSYVLSLKGLIPCADDRPMCSTHVLSDPSSFEEPLLDTAITIIVDEKGELTSVLQSGLGTSGSLNTLSQCISAAKARRISLTGIMGVVE